MRLITRECSLDGASGPYGSDAIAALINIILKKTNNGGQSRRHLRRVLRWAVASPGKCRETFGFGPVPGGFLNLTAEVRNHGHSFRAAWMAVL